jgi:alcohol dehydrogenase class IV
MTVTFEFATAQRIIFGWGASERIAAEAEAFGRRAFVLTGKHPERCAPVLQQLHDRHLSAAVFPVDGEPTTATAHAALEKARAFGAELVIGIGGGSVIDTGKVVAAMLVNGGELMDYLEVIGAGRSLARPGAPYVAVPTTAGTGAEVTRNAVIGSPAHRVKVSLRGRHLLPRLAVVDPQTTVTAPPSLTAAAGMDALTQLLEAFVSPAANPLTDGFCREGLRRAAGALRPAVADGRDRRAREAMSLASLLSGLALANARLGAVHGIAGPFGGMFKSPHGAVCGRLLPRVTAANIAALRQRAPDSPALARYGEAAAILTGRDRAAAEEAVDWLAALLDELDLPPLSAYGFTADRTAELAGKAMAASSMRGNPIALEAAELEAVLLAAM